jgi:hypothetical protein
LQFRLGPICQGAKRRHSSTYVARQSAGRDEQFLTYFQVAVFVGLDALAETMLTGGYTLPHDLEAAAVHAERALAIGGGSAWAWGRGAWVKAYRGLAGRDGRVRDREIVGACRPAEFPLVDRYRVGLFPEWAL